MATVHPRLQMDTFRFALLGSHGEALKKPFEDDWPNTANYRHDHPKLSSHRGNHGICGGYGDLHIIDCDDLSRWDELQIFSLIPATFTVESRPGHRQYYVTCKEHFQSGGLFDPEKTELNKDSKPEYVHIGDIKGVGGQAVAPGCRHPSGSTYQVVEDVPIAEVSPDHLRSIIKKFRQYKKVNSNYLKAEDQARRARQRRYEEKDPLNSLRVQDILPPKGNVTQSGDELRGDHPVHGSTNGGNYVINTAKNVWHCKRCESGGGAAAAIAVKHGLISCSDATQGELRGDLFKQVLKIANEEYLHHAGPIISEEDLKELPKSFNPRLEVHLEDSNFITKYMVYGKTTSDAYEEYHFASGLVLLSVAADRQIVISMKHGDIYPNIWIFPIGDSTVSRKTTAHKLCKLILKNKYPKRSLPSSFSPEALMDAISATPRCYYLKDEAGSLLSSLCKDYMAETRDFLAEIFECDDYYRKLKKSECQIINPYITQYLMTTPDNLKEYTTPLDLTSGWLLRYLWMYPNYPKEWKPFAEKDASDFERFTTITGEYNLIVEKLATARRLTMTEESMQFYQEWHRSIEEVAMREADNITKALAGRLTTYAIKMAALFTIGRADFDENSKIELPHIQEAARLVVEYFLPIGKIIIDEVARAESKNLQEKILGTLKRFNGRISQRDLLRALHTKLSDVDDAIKALMLSEEIQSVQVNGKKGNILYYVSLKSKTEGCHSVIVSHNLVYKGNNKGSLYTPSCGTMTHRQVGQDGVEEGEDTPPALGPHPRKEDPEITRLRAGHAAYRKRYDKHTCSRCGKHDDIPLVMHDHRGYYCETCRRDGPSEPIKADPQIKLSEVASAN